MSGELFSFLNIKGVTTGVLSRILILGRKVVVGVGPVGRACNILAGVWEDFPPASILSLLRVVLGHSETVFGFQ